MWNPFAPSITLSAQDVISILGTKEAELQIARANFQQALKIIEELKKQIPPVGSAK